MKAALTEILYVYAFGITPLEWHVPRVSEAAKRLAGLRQRLAERPAV